MKNKKHPGSYEPGCLLLLGLGFQLLADGAVVAFGSGGMKFHFGFQQVLGIGHQVGGSACQNLGSQQQTLVGD